MNMDIEEAGRDDRGSPQPIRVRGKLLRIAAHRLEIDVADLELRDGIFGKVQYAAMREVAVLLAGRLRRQLGLDQPIMTQYLFWLIGNDWWQFDRDGDGEHREEVRDHQEGTVGRVPHRSRQGCRRRTAGGSSGGWLRSSPSR